MKGLYLRTVYFLGLKSGGSVTHTSGVINSLKKEIDLDVYSNDHLPGVTSPYEIISPVWKKIPFFNELRYNFKVLKALRGKVDHDFIYQRYSGGSFEGARLSRKHNIPFILEFNSSEVWKLQNWSRTGKPLKDFIKRFIQLPITRRIERYNLKTAHRIVVVSDVLRQNLVAQGIEEERIIVNPNGVNLERFDIPEKQDSVVEKYELKDKYVVGFIGTFGKWHGVLELAKAAVGFYEKHPELHSKVEFLIIGSGKLFPEAKSIVDASPHSSNIHLTGAIPQKESPAFLKSCDMFLSPHIPNPDGTKFFGSPTKLFEYMACGKPIIASDLDQIGDVLTHGVDGHLVKPGDIDALITAIQHVYSDEEYARSIAKGARATVEREFTWDAHVKRILDKLNLD